mmetsp:Transcript_36618/g.105288  ORF Transcript_36618/g.105288 Transcript_36618/m.105288 type:complete len:210 (+) Transcript_36618:142-771(+)
MSMPQAAPERKLRAHSRTSQQSCSTAQAMAHTAARLTSWSWSCAHVVKHLRAQARTSLLQPASLARRSTMRTMSKSSSAGMSRAARAIFSPASPPTKAVNKSLKTQLSAFSSKMTARIALCRTISRSKSAAGATSLHVTGCTRSRSADSTRRAIAQTAPNSSDELPSSTATSPNSDGSSQVVPQSKRVAAMRTKQCLWVSSARARPNQN